MNVIKHHEKRKHTPWEHAIKLRAVIRKPVSRRTYCVWIIFTREIKKKPTDRLSHCRTSKRQTSLELFVVSVYTVEPFQNGHLGDRRKWPLWRGKFSRGVQHVCCAKFMLTVIHNIMIYMYRDRIHTKN